MCFASSTPKFDSHDWNACNKGIIYARKRFFLRIAYKSTARSPRKWEISHHYKNTHHSSIGLFPAITRNVLEDIKTAVKGESHLQYARRLILQHAILNDMPPGEWRWNPTDSSLRRWMDIDIEVISIDAELSQNLYHRLKPYSMYMPKDRIFQHCVGGFSVIVPETAHERLACLLNEKSGIKIKYRQIRRNH